MKYLPLGTTDESYGWQLSAAIWRLSRPEADGDSTTRYYVAPKAHPDTGYIYLPVDEGDTQPVHAQADVDAILPLLTAVEGDDRDALRDPLEAAKGNRVTVIDLFPATVRANEIDSADWPEEEETL